MGTNSKGNMRTEIISGIERDNALFDSIKNSRFLHLSRRKGNCWQTMKSQFEGGSLSSGIKISKPTITHGSDNLAAGKMAISFRIRHKKMIFLSHYDRDTLTWPEHIVKAQRKLFERQQPPEDIIVRFWKSRNRVTYAKLEDMSAGGVCITTSSGDYDGTYTCCIDAEIPLMFDAIVNSIEFHENHSTVSFQFVGIDFDPVKHLNRIGRVLSKWNHRRRKRLSCVS